MLTKKKSEELARQIEYVKLQCFQIDWGYASEVAHAFDMQATRQDSIAVLNHMHPLEANDLLRQQAKALKHLINFIDALKKCEALKEQVAQRNMTNEKIQSLFL